MSPGELVMVVSPGEDGESSGERDGREAGLGLETGGAPAGQVAVQQGEECGHCDCHRL